MINESIKAALLQLSVENDNHWTTDGLPRIETLKFLTGDQSLTREAVSAALPGFNRVAQIPTSVVTTENIPENIALVDSIKKPDLLSELELAQDLLVEITNKRDTLNDDLISQQLIVTNLLQRVEDEIGVVTTQDQIMLYLANQQQLLLERAVKLKLIADSGINLKDLAEGLKSPLDVAMSRKR